MIYYTFASIKYNKQVVDLVAGSTEVNNAFDAASIVIAVFVAMFVMYSNSFFTKKRKKELALYSILGVKKKQIGRMLFYENLVMGFLALVAGILIGTLFSKLFVMVLIHIMSFDVNVKFTISLKAIISTIIVFLIIFTIASFHSYTLAYRFQLIELFKAEKVAQKEPKPSLIVALLSMAFIGTGYYMALSFKFDDLSSFLSNLLAILVCTVIGTFMFFSSLIIFIVKFSKKNKVKYYKGLNMIATSQLLYRIKSNGRLLAIIAVLSATTITAMGISASTYYEQINSINKMSPFSYSYNSNSKRLDEKIQKIISKYPSNKIISSTNSEFMIIDSKIPKILKMKLYTPNSKSFVISESTMKELSKARGVNYNISLNSNEVFFFMTRYSAKLMESPFGKNIELKIKDKFASLKIKAFKESLLTNPISINNSYMNDTIVVTDEVYNKLYDKDNVIKSTFINIENQSQSKNLTTEIEESLGSRGALSSYYELYRSTMTDMGIIIFLSSFVGFIFLICTGSIIVFKQLSEANDDKDKYDILKKIGVKKSEIRISIAKQMALMFVLPLVIGIAHSFIALTILQLLLNSSLAYPVLITVGVYTLIYLIYYILTVNSYWKIVDVKDN